MEERYLDDPELQVELLRKTLKLPEDLITKIVSLNYGKALEHILTVFTVYYPECKIYGWQRNSEIIERHCYTDIDNYNIDFNGMEICESLHKEFDAYCEIMDLILKYIHDWNNKVIEEVLNKFFREENTEKNKEEERYEKR